MHSVHVASADAAVLVLLPLLLLLQVFSGHRVQ
jgi:hypothetical protein